MKLQLMAITILTSFSSMQSSLDAGPIVIGPGSHAPIYEPNNVDYHILDGTQIIAPSVSGPPSTFVIGADAIEFRGGGYLQIDGGNYSGGSATYSGTVLSATAAGGDGLHLRNSSGEIDGGTFIGGDGTSSTGNGQGGNGLFVFQSHLVINDGYFEGGTSTWHQGGIHVVKKQGIEVNGSVLELRGGEVVGDLQVDSNASLWVFGSDLSYVGTTLSGKYADGTPFTHNVPRIGGTVLFNPDIPVPEPDALILLALGCLFVAGNRRVQRLD
jgi:hypothetical protein